MKYLIIIAVISFGAYNFYLTENKGSSPSPTSAKSRDVSQAIAKAFKKCTTSESLEPRSSNEHLIFNFIESLTNRGSLSLNLLKLKSR